MKAVKSIVFTLAVLNSASFAHAQELISLSGPATQGQPVTINYDRPEGSDGDVTLDVTWTPPGNTVLVTIHAGSNSATVTAPGSALEVLIEDTSGVSESFDAPVRISELLPVQSRHVETKRADALPWRRPTFLCEQKG